MCCQYSLLCRISQACRAAESVGGVECPNAAAVRQQHNTAQFFTYTCILQDICVLREGLCPLLEPPLNAKSHCYVQGLNIAMHDVLGASWLYHLDKGYCRVGVASVPNNSKRLCRRTSELSEALLLWSHSQPLTVCSYQFASFAMQGVAAYASSLQAEAASKVATPTRLQ